MIPIHLFLALIVLLVALSGCGKKAAEEVVVESSDAFVQLQLARTDIQGFTDLGSEGAAEVDALGGKLYSEVFGSVNASSVKDFFHTRIHHIVDIENTRVLVKGKITNKKWTEDSGTEPTGPKKGRIAGVNIGIQYWLLALVNRATIAILDQTNRMVILESSRTGVMGMGPGYVETDKTRQGKEITIPRGFRQSVLVHEARHSDCTGGIDDAMLETMRESKNADDFKEKVPMMACGHMHQKCKAGDFEGIAACDSEMFGSYAVGAIFALGEYYRLRKGDDRVSAEIMKGHFIDQITRLESVENIDDYLGGKLNVHPDMSSTGYVGGKLR